MKLMSKEKTPREQAWEWMCSEKGFTLKQLVSATGMNPATAATFIKYLRKKHRLWMLNKHQGRRPARYRVHDKTPLAFGTENYVKPKRRMLKKTARQRMWTSMRILRAFSIADVSAGAGAPYDQVCRYIRCLVAAGYVRLMRGPKTRGDSGGKGEFARFRLIHDSGPRYPIARKCAGGLYDQNTDEFHAYVEVESALKHALKPSGAQHEKPTRRMA